MPEGSEDFANLLIEYREAMSGENYTNDVTSPNWYARVPGTEGLDAEIITISSNYFRIVATAELNGVRATTTAVVRRERKSASSAWQCKVLNWKTE
jgi:hypothetical protein